MFNYHSLPLPTIAARLGRPVRPYPDPGLRRCSYFGWRWLGLDTLGFSRAQLGTQLGYFEAICGLFWKLVNAGKPLTDAGFGVVPGAELNRRHTDFQPCNRALQAIEKQAQPASLADEK